jgi:hypothetical protein
MSKLLIGNWGTEAEQASLPRDKRRSCGCQGQRMIWCAQPGDAIILPFRPNPQFLAYATELTGVRAGSLEVIVPPVGEGDDGYLLTRDRFKDDEFVASLRRIVRERGIDQADPFWFNDYVNELIKRLGLDKGTPGFGFMDQGGDVMVNSKVAFRALAAGTGLPIPEGVVTETQEEAVDFLWGLLRSGRSAIAKQDDASAGLGNEVMTPTARVDVIGTLHHVVLTDGAALADHVAKRWPWYTGGRCHRAVFEEYAAGSVPIWGEAAITDESVKIYGYGKVRMNPVCDGVIIPVPPPDSGAEAFRGFLEHLERCAETMRAMGYRGLTNIDAILTPEGRVLFNEINGRYGGSTHLFAIGERIVGGDFLADRCILEQRECRYPAFDITWHELSTSGLAYDPAKRTGVIISVFGTGSDGTGGEACIVGTDLAEAERIERALMELFLPERGHRPARKAGSRRTPELVG